MDRLSLPRYQPAPHNTPAPHSNIMAVNTIPVELLHEIFTYLGFTDQLSVPLVSPRWYATSRVALYQSLSLIPVSLMLFLRTVLTPGLEYLATHVRTLTVTWKSLHAEPIEPADLPRFDAAAQHYCLTQPRTMTNDYVELLLHLLPRVHELHLCPPDAPSSYNDFLGATPNSVHLPLALRSVRHLSCTWISHHHGVTSEMLLAMLTLPNIRTLEVEILEDIDDPYPAITTATSPISKLHISYSQISLQSLARILQVPWALRHLSFSSTTYVMSTNLEELYPALEPLRPTLQLLELQVGQGNA